MAKKYVSNFLLDNNTTVWVEDEEARTAAAAAQATANGLEPRVEALEDLVEPTVKNMIVVSDSYGLGRNNTESWVTNFASYMTEYNNVYNWSNGSMGIVWVGDGGYNAEGFMRSKESEIADKASVTDVIIAMGANDLNGYSDFDTTFASLVSYINATYPNAKICLGMIGNVKEKTTAEYNGYCNVLTLYREACKNHPGCRYLNGVEYIMHAAIFFQTDGVHPTTNGSRWLAKGVAEAFRSGSYTFVVRGVSQVGDVVIHMTINGDTASITVLDSTVSQKYFANRQYSAWFDITDPLLYVIAGMPVIAMVQAFDNSANPLPLSFKYAHGTTYLSTMNTQAKTMGAGALYGCTITFPTIQA